MLSTRPRSEWRLLQGPVPEPPDPSVVLESQGILERRRPGRDEQDHGREGGLQGLRLVALCLLAWKYFHMLTNGKDTRMCGHINITRGKRSVCKWKCLAEAGIRRVFFFFVFLIKEQTIFTAVERNGKEC